MTTKKIFSTIVDMSKKTRILTGLTLLLATLAFSGCELSEKRSSITVDMTKEDTSEDRPGVSLTGMVVEATGRFFLRTNGKDTEITSRKIDIVPYVGKNVEVHGEFSGTTLYLDSIK